MKKSEQGIEGILSLKLPDSYKPPMARPTRRNTKAATIIKIQDEYEKPEKLSQISSETNININFLTNKKKVSDFETKEQNVFVKKFREQNVTEKKIYLMKSFLKKKKKIDNEKDKKLFSFNNFFFLKGTNGSKIFILAVSNSCFRKAQGI